MFCKYLTFPQPRFIIEAIAERSAHMIDTAAKFPELCLGCSPALNRELFPAQSAAFPLALSAAFPIALRALPASWFRDLDEPDRLQGRGMG